MGPVSLCCWCLAAFVNTVAAGEGEPMKSKRVLLKTGSDKIITV